MTPLFCLWAMIGCGLAQNQTDQQIKQFSEMVRGWGYQYTHKAASTLTRSKVEVQCYFWSRQDAPTHPFGGMSLFKTLAIPDQLSNEEVRDHVQRTFPEGVVNFVIHVDRSILASTNVLANANGSTADIRADLDQRWEEIVNLQSWLGATSRQRPASHGKSPSLDERVMYSVDDYDISYLVKHWGWVYTGGYGGEGAGWASPGQIGNQMVWFRGSNTRERSQIDSDLQVSTEIAIPKGLTENQACADLSKTENWARFTNEGTPNHITVRTTLNLAKGMTVNELRAKIAYFVKRSTAIAIKS